MALKRSKKPYSVSQKSNFLKIIAVAISATAVVLLLAFLFFDAPELTEAEYAQRLDSAKAALSIGQFELANEFAGSISPNSQSWRPARLVVGEAAFLEGRYSDAAKIFLEVADDRSEDGLVAKFSAAEAYRAQGDLANALRYYQEIYAIKPSFDEVQPRIAFLLGITGQRWESMPYLVGMIRDKSWSLDSLSILADLERSIEQPDFVKQCLSFAANEPLSQLALASQHIADGQPLEATGLLQQVIANRPEIIAAHCLLGEVHVAPNPTFFQAWNQRLPKAAEQHPDVWFVRGLVARSQNQLELSAGCFAKAITLVPEHRRATYQLGQTLIALKHPQADAFVERATLQMELSRIVDEVLKTQGRNFKAVQKAAELSEQMGRFFEAWAWAMSASEMFGRDDWSTEMVQRVSQRLAQDSPRTFSEYRLTGQIDLSKYVSLANGDSLRKLASSSLAADGNAPESQRTQTIIKFSANKLEPHFTYNNGADPNTPGARMFEQTGGGVGVIDFDADHWPDLYFTQGNHWKSGSTIPEANSSFHDALYRNLARQGMVEVASQAGIRNVSFSQGIAVGDYDADGFPDIYVASVGYNHLYRNNGDGTFTERSEQVEERTDQWTTSCVMVDLTGDTLPEIIDINYVQGDDVYTKICGGRGCSPKVFSGSPDQVFVNDGQGKFRKLDNGTPQAEAKGLGVLVAKFGNDSTPSLFIANDQVPNFLLSVNQDSSGDIRLKDRALVSGVAYNVDGLAMACMGIASDDLDGNGLLDFLVTNFADEPNSLYLQDTAGLFIDATRGSGLLDASYPYVGWGTQFLDADLDGESDLVVGNGHIDDYRDEGKLYQMPAQFFRNIGRGRFQQISPQQLGPFFQENYLARGLARVDWNRDGLFDFAVSNINQPAALVINETEKAGNFLNLVLHGTVSAREPIGTLATVESGSKRWTRQLTAGDGFQATNQKVLQVGLGDANQVDRLTISWPSGLQTKITDLPANTTVHVIEAAQNCFTEAGDGVAVELENE